MSLRDPAGFQTDPDSVERIEKASARLVSYAMNSALQLAADEFAAILSGAAGPTPLGVNIGDRANYLGEDITRMAIDGIGLPKVPDGRLFGAIDYKAATIAFLPDLAVEQALFVDSKAEMNSLNVARVQVTQTSLEIRQLRQGMPIAVQGLVQPVWTSAGHNYLTSTFFVKYHYSATALRRISVVALPHAFLQNRYNPNAGDGIWNVGPNSPLRAEGFRTRVNFTLLEAKASWRVQRLIPGIPWSFRE